MVSVPSVGVVMKLFPAFNLVIFSVVYNLAEQQHVCTTIGTV